MTYTYTHIPIFNNYVPVPRAISNFKSSRAKFCFIIVAFLENATIGYSLESVCVFVCVFLHDNSKRNRSRNTKSEYIVAYENSSDEFDIELHRIKVKVTVGVQKFSPFTTNKLSGPIVQLWYKLGTLY